MTAAFALPDGLAAPAPAAGLRVERIDTLARFAAVRAAWDRLYARDPEAQFFLSSTFLAGAFEMNPGRWLVLVAQGADGEIIGLLPLRWKLVWSETRRQLRNELESGGRLHWADHVGLLCLPEHEEPAIAALADAVKRLNWSRLTLKGLRASDRRFGLFIGPFVEERFAIEALTQVANDGATDNMLSPVVALPDSFDAYLARRLRSNTREKIRRALRDFERDPTLAVTVADAATRERDVGILIRLWSDMWQERKGEDTAPHALQYGRIVTRGLEDGTARLSVLWRGETPLGALVTFVDRVKDDVLYFVSGRDRSCREIDVGRILHMHEIRWAIGEGMRSYEFLRGNEPYKYLLGGVDRRLRYPLIRTQTGTNLGGRLEPASIDAAMRIAEEFAAAGRLGRAKVACRQIIATAPDHAAAAKLLAKVIAAE